MGYSFRLTARVLLYVPSHRQDSTYYLCYTSREALAGTRNSSMGPPHFTSFQKISLRTGHCELKGHLQKIGIQPLALCDCGKDDQTPNHFLQSCPLYNRERQHIWPVSTTMDTKLWGSANDLHLTTHFPTLTGQRIWHNQSNENNKITK